MDIYKEALETHKKLKGKIQIGLRAIPDSRKKLSLFYTPGVGGVARYTGLHPKQMRDYTWTNNLVAVISDGSSVLGLGNIGPYGAMPVMEGKALLFKHFANIDAVPLVLDVHNTGEIISAIKAIAPSFGAINLEDIAAPQCFEIEERLKDELDIPIMHDDQHGTAVVVLGGLISAAGLRSQKLSEAKVVIAGAGAAGVATALLLQHYGVNNILVVDSQGIIGPKRRDLNDSKKVLLGLNQSRINGSLKDALQEADIFIGVSRGGLLKPTMIKSMAKKPIIFAMANPEPEILPKAAKEAGAYIVATGRSDFPNQINNALAFPGIFRGALDNRVKKITDTHKIAAAQAIASLVPRPSPDEIIPDIFNKNLVQVVAKSIKN